MNRMRRGFTPALISLGFLVALRSADHPPQPQDGVEGTVTVRHATAFDVSPSLAAAAIRTTGSAQQPAAAPITPPVITSPPGSSAVEQTTPGARPAATLVDQFDGLGVGFDGPQGPATVRQPSDNSLAVGPNHIVQTVNSRMAIFTKKGKQYETSGKIL